MSHFDFVQIILPYMKVEGLPTSAQLDDALNLSPEKLEEFIQHETEDKKAEIRQLATQFNDEIIRQSNCLKKFIDEIKIELAAVEVNPDIVLLVALNKMALYFQELKETLARSELSTGQNETLTNRLLLAYTQTIIKDWYGSNDNNKCVTKLPIANWLYLDDSFLRIMTEINKLSGTRNITIASIIKSYFKQNKKEPAIISKDIIKLKYFLPLQRLKNIRNKLKNDNASLAEQKKHFPMKQFELFTLELSRLANEYAENIVNKESIHLVTSAFSQLLKDLQTIDIHKQDRLDFKQQKNNLTIAQLLPGIEDLIIALKTPDNSKNILDCVTILSEMLQNMATTYDQTLFNAKERRTISEYLEIVLQKKIGQNQTLNMGLLLSTIESLIELLARYVESQRSPSSHNSNETISHSEDAELSDLQKLLQDAYPQLTNSDLLEVPSSAEKEQQNIVQSASIPEIIYEPEAFTAIDSNMMTALKRKLDQGEKGKLSESAETPHEQDLFNFLFQFQKTAPESVETLSRRTRLYHHNNRTVSTLEIEPIPLSPRSKQQSAPTSPSPTLFTPKGRPRSQDETLQRTTSGSRLKFNLLQSRDKKHDSKKTANEMLEKKKP